MPDTFFRNEKIGGLTKFCTKTGQFFMLKITDKKTWTENLTSQKITMVLNPGHFQNIHAPLLPKQQHISNESRRNEIKCFSSSMVLNVQWQWFSSSGQFHNILAPNLYIRVFPDGDVLYSIRSRLFTYLSLMHKIDNMHSIRSRFIITATITP